MNLITPSGKNAARKIQQIIKSYHDQHLRGVWTLEQARAEAKQSILSIINRSYVVF